VGEGIEEFPDLKVLGPCGRGMGIEELEAFGNGSAWEQKDGGVE
jgi:hypothetical protein